MEMKPHHCFTMLLKKKKIFSSLCHMLPGHTMHVGSIFPVAVAGGEKKPSEALHQPHLLHNQFVYVIVVVNPQMYTDGIFATGI